MPAKKSEITKLAAAIAKASKAKRSTKKKRTWEQRTYPTSKYYRTYHERNDASKALYGESYRKATDEQKKAREAAHMVGRGRYRFGRNMAKQINQAGLVARAAAPYAQQAYSMYSGGGLYTGHGLYSAASTSAVQGNSLIDGMGKSIPQFGTIGDETGALVVQHSEFLADVYALPWTNSTTPTLTFQNTDYSINPGLTRTFPFLSQVASNFEEYEMVQLMFTYVPKLSSNLSSSDGQVGTVLMYTDYNPDDPKKTSKQQMMQSYGTSNGRVVDSVLHGVECDPTKLKGDGHKFVRVRGTTASLDDYDAGRFQIAVMNTPFELADQVIGELHVSYTCLLRKPRVFSLYGFTLDKDEYFITSDGPSYDSGVVTTSGQFNSIGTSLAINAGQGSLQVTFPASFAGMVRIAYHKDNKNQLLGNTLDGSVNYKYSGNISIVEAFPDNIDYADKSIRAPYDTRDTTREQFELVVRVEQAESGVDNKVTVSTRYGNATDPSQPCATFLQIERYNNFEQDTVQTFS